MSDSSAVTIGGKHLRLSNLGKPPYPSGFTKAQVIDIGADGQTSFRLVAPGLLGFSPFGRYDYLLNVPRNAGRPSSRAPVS